MAQTESCLFPYSLLEYPKVRKMITELGELAEMDFMKVFLLIKKGKGTYPRDSIMMMAHGNKRRTARLNKMLRNYSLFVVSHDMVSMRNDLKKWLRERKSKRKTEEDLDALHRKQAEKGLFPNSEFKESDDKIEARLEQDLIDFE